MSQGMVYLLVSGLLAVGTPSSLSVYTLILENDLPTWSLKWTLPYVTVLSRVTTLVKHSIKDSQDCLACASLHRSCILLAQPRYV